MKRNLKTLTEQFTDARTNYNRILGRSDKSLINEQITNPNARCYRLRTCWGSTGQYFIGTVDGDVPQPGQVIDRIVQGRPTYIHNVTDATNDCTTIGMIPGSGQGPGGTATPQDQTLYQGTTCCPHVCGTSNCAPGTCCTCTGGQVGSPGYIGFTPGMNMAGCSGNGNMCCGNPTYNASPNSDCGGVISTPCQFYGCTDSTAINYNAAIDPNCDDGSCILPNQIGCTDSTATNYNPQATIDDGSCIFTPPCDTTPNSPCAQQWFQNPNATWASTWINNRDCSNYTWPSTNLETQALSIMASAPNPQPNVYNDWNDIWGAADTAFPNITGPPKNTFIAKMAKAKYSQCQKQACNC
tara:strand:- start:3192 stop:4253 length:1062 start_codon:yes stop_codon:yes gene_type:complete